MENNNSPILVTGGNGYIASWIIKYLLEDGHTVIATVRSTSNQKKVKHLLDIAANAKGKLSIVEADLLKEGSFDAAAKGCEIVMHTASPFILDIKNPQKELIDPALNGTKNVLGAVNRSRTVKKVVLTSSVAAIFGDAIECEQTKGKMFDESHWNTTSSLEHNPYSFSKVLAEKAAWDIQKTQNSWELVTINPAFVLGPSLSADSQSESIKLMSDIVKGKLMFGVPELYIGYVDVRDVALAHIKAAFSDNAKGRYITVATSGGFIEMANQIREQYGNKLRIPKSTLPKWLLLIVGPSQGLTRKYSQKNLGYKVAFDNSKIKCDLGMEFRPLKETMLDHTAQILGNRK
jgi:nucleoside-diphosphate-sugar epimerase